MDYAIAQARQRGIYILFTPHHDLLRLVAGRQAHDDYHGFLEVLRRGDLGQEPTAIAAQSNYVWQILST